MRHWTEHNIRVHALYCVLALMIAHLMRRTAHQAGLHLSVRALLAQLANIQQTVLLTRPTRRPRPDTCSPTGPTSSSNCSTSSTSPAGPHRLGNTPSKDQHSG